MRTSLIVLFTLLAPMASSQTADFVVVNARVYTVDEAQPHAEAFAVHDGRFVMVGEVDAVRAAFPAARVIDAGNRAVIPGLIDAHAHLMGLGTSLMQADLVGTQSKSEIVARLQAFERDLPEEAWLTGRGWDQNEWPEREFPSAADLDVAFPDRPIWLRRIDGHAAWANTAALRAAGLDPNAEAPADPSGGAVLRAADGTPTGVFIDAAMQLVAGAVPTLSPEEMREALRRALAETGRYGLTGIHEAGMSLDVFDLYQEAIAAGTFTIRNHAMVSPGSMLDYVCENGVVSSDDTLGLGGRLAVRALKLYADGALGSRGAALLDDYHDDPGNRGLLIQSPEAYAAIVNRAMGCGLQVNTHAIGDRGARLVLDAYQDAFEAIPGASGGRHRMEHAQVVSLDDIPRFAELGVIASVQPTHATSDMPWAEDRVGPDRIRGAYAWRRLLDAGARLALGSDFPVERVNPLLGFHAAVSRQDTTGYPPGGWYPDQALTREEALRGFTLDAAYAAFQEDQLGSIQVGKRADFVILSDDIMSVPVDDILNTHVVATYLDGERLYEASE
ncbi:amidohydrolase [soil metagenome]